jgi:uncharacterized iron-regulated protein
MLPTMGVNRLLVATLCALLPAFAAACGGPAQSVEDPARMHAREGHGGRGRGMDIRKAAMPFRVLEARGGKEVSEDAFFTALAGADAVCLGEQHNNPHHHWVQLMVVEKLSAAAGERAFAVGFEMFQTPFQGVLDDYAAGRIDEGQLLARSGWEERWGYDFAFYRPILEVAVAASRPLLALNAPKELTGKVGKGGLAGLSPEEKKRLPELDLADEEHKAWFQQATEGHGGPAEVFDNFYAAQVIWDETMAERAATWLAAQKGPRQVAILAGTGHCFDAAIPKRLARRGVGKVISVQAVLDDGGSAVADLLAAPENDFLVVLDAR